MSVLYVIEEMDFIALKVRTELSWGNLSSHVTKLEEKGYIKVRKEIKGKKPRSFASVTPEGKAAFGKYMENIQIYFAQMAHQAKKKAEDATNSS